jgi:hypothetical protein
VHNEILDVSGEISLRRRNFKFYFTSNRNLKAPKINTKYGLNTLAEGTINLSVGCLTTLAGAQNIQRRITELSENNELQKDTVERRSGIA